MLTIGRFADATGLTVKALRHYDGIGLLVPAHVDGTTGYRLYDPAQVEKAATIRRLRALEFPLEEIRTLLEGDGDTLRAGLAAQGHRVGTEAGAKQLLLTELAALLQGGGAPLEIEIRDEPELRLAATMRQLHEDDLRDGVLEPMFMGVREWLRERGARPAGHRTAVWRRGDQWGWHFAEAGWPVDSGVESEGTVAVQVYPASPAATYDYPGPLDDFGPIAQRFMATVLGRDLRVAQPIRVVYPDYDRARIVWPIEA